MNRNETLTDFFRGYASLALRPDPASLAAYYDGSFLAAGPRGGAAFANDEAFLEWLRQVHQFNEASGMTSMTVDSVSEIPVSGVYTLVNVRWAATFRRTGDAPIPFTISYLLRQAGDDFRIAAYISHEDQEEAMRSAGLL